MTARLQRFVRAARRDAMVLRHLGRVLECPRPAFADGWGIVCARGTVALICSTLWWFN
jgi:hypothetical protein